MGKPADETFPRRTVAVYVTGHYRTVPFVLGKDAAQLVGNRQVEKKGIDFIIVAKAPAIQVCTSNRTKPVVYHHHFRVMESSIVNIDARSLFA